MESIELRDLAHELRQPLSTIEAIAYYLTLVLPHEDQKTQEQLDQLQKLVEQTNWILSNSLQLCTAHPPAPERVDLEEIIVEAATSQSSLRLDLCGDSQARVDPGLARALIANLLTLFRQVASDENPATVRTSRCEDGVMLALETTANGLKSVAGVALSLSSARSIAEAHAGSLDLTTGASGTRLQVVLP
jgi:signal transduction histidine kinase